MSDHELIADDERERFAGTSAVSDEQSFGAEREEASRTSEYEEGRRAAHQAERDAEFRQGRSAELGDEENKGLLGKLRGRG
jgi:hypothetical protein